MAGLSLYCAGVIDTSALTCSTGWQAIVATPPFDPSQLDPATIVGALGAGMFVSTTLFAFVFGCRQILNFLK